MKRKLTEEEYFKLAHHEDEVVHHRLSWLFAGQPLLFLAFAQLATAATGDPIIKAKALYWLPVVGFCMAFSMWIGVLGAAFAVKHLTTLREADTVSGVLTATTRMGMTPPLTIPLVLMVVWYRLWV